MTIVFPIHGGDAHQAIVHAKWMAMMGKVRHKIPVLISHDQSLNRDVLKTFRDLLLKSFEKVEVHRYPRPIDIGWPSAPNWAWQHTARHMSSIGSWFWMEADAVALKPDWCERIEAEYEQRGMAFMGPKVQGMAHVNGVAVYPKNTPSMLPIAMRSKTMAWDYEAGPEMLDKTHDSSDLTQHVWSVENGRWLECGGGQVPMLVTRDELLRNLKPTAVLLHRIKDNSVTKMLMRGEVVL